MIKQLQTGMYVTASSREGRDQSFSNMLLHVESVNDTHALVVSVNDPLTLYRQPFLIVIAQYIFCEATETMVRLLKDKANR